MNPLQEKLEAAIAAVRQERTFQLAGSGSVGTPDQLMHVERELTQMLEDIKQGQCMSDRTGMGRMVVDSWPCQHDLTEQVCAAVNAYSAFASRASSS